MYVYHEYFKAEKVALVYPGAELIKGGKYFDKDMACALIRIPTDSTVSAWQEGVKEVVGRWMA